MNTQPLLTLKALRQGALDEAAQRALFSQALVQHKTSSNTPNDAGLVLEVADHLSYTLLSEQRYAEARDIAEQALQIGADAALLHTLALSEHALGESKKAMTHLEQALKHLGEAADAQTSEMRSDMLEHLAQIQQSQNQHLRAIQNLERAAELLQTQQEKEGYIRVKTQLATLAHELGDAIQASEHWMDVLSVARAPAMGNTYFEHAARALLQLADLAREGENTELENNLRREAVGVLAEAGMLKELAQTLFRMARSQEQRETMWQAAWLMLAVTQNIEGLINAHAWLYMREEQKTDPDATLLAAAIWASIESTQNMEKPDDMAQHARITRMALSQLFTCARIQGIHESEIKTWMEREKLRLSDGVIQTMLNRIESQIESSAWLFDRYHIK
jgi:tetratricopeptide (TPR) repeat protein